LLPLLNHPYPDTVGFVANMLRGGGRIRYVGDKRRQVVYDLDNADEKVEALVAELMAAETFTCFGPDTLAEARNRGYRLAPALAAARAAAAAAASRSRAAAASWLGAPSVQAEDQHQHGAGQQPRDHPLGNRAEVADAPPAPVGRVAWAGGALVRRRLLRASQVVWVVLPWGSVVLVRRPRAS